MKVLAALLVFATTTLHVEAKNIVCGPKKTSQTVTVEAGDSYSLKTHKGRKYRGNTKCTVDYKMGETCTQISFVCNKFNTNNKDRKRCRKGDKVTVTANGKTNVYCKTRKPKVTSAGDLSVVFTSNAKKHSSGASCKAICTEAASTDTTTEGWGGATWPSSGGYNGTWPQEPVVENNYTAKGQMIDLDTTMQAYQIGSGSKMVVWSHDIYGLTGEKSDDGRTKEWADFLAENGYNVLVPDWYRGNNLPGGTFGPTTPAWSSSVTNWTKIESDWTNVILPYLQKESPSSIGMIGTCWGSYPVVHLSMFDTISAGVSMHPSHPILMATAGEDEAEVLGLIQSPQLFLVEGEAVDSVKTGGLAEEVLGDKLTVVEFPDMTHGWTVRGNLGEPDVARDVLKAKQLVLDFFASNLN